MATIVTNNTFRFTAPIVEAPAPIVEAPAPIVEAPATIVEAPAEATYSTRIKSSEYPGSGSWWLLSQTTGEFVEIGRHSAARGINITIPLPTGVYTLGAGKGKGQVRKLIVV